MEIEQLKQLHYSNFDKVTNGQYTDEQVVGSITKISIDYAINILSDVIFTNGIIDFDDPYLNNEIGDKGLKKLNELILIKSKF